MPQDRKTIVITGGNSGIGFETAQRLAEDGWRIIITGRDRPSLERSVAELRCNRGRPVEYRLGDFTSLASVRALAEDLKREPRIDVLLNNVGVVLSHRRVTADGNEMMLQVNHLAPFLLTNLLVGKLGEAAPARIINVSSNMHRWARTHGFGDFQFERRYGFLLAYRRTKLYNVMFTRELARRINGSTVTANAIYPGPVRTRIGRDGDTTGLLGLLWPAMMWYLMRDPYLGDKSTAYAVAAPGLDGVTGAYISPRHEAETPSPLALDDAANRRLWHLSARLVGLA